MGIFNNSTVSTAQLSPVILPVHQNTSNSDAYRMQNYMTRQNVAGSKSDASDDAYLYKLSGLEGANTAIIQQSQELDSYEKQIKSEFFNKMIAPGTTDLQAQQLAQDYYSKKFKLASKKMYLQMYSEATKSDRKLWEDKWKEYGDEGTLDMPTLLGNIGALTTDTSSTGDGHTARTYNLFAQAANGLIATDKRGNALSQGDYMVARSKSTAVDADGSPIRFRPPVEAMNSKDYKKEVEGLMSLTSGGMSSSNSRRLVVDDKTLDTNESDLQQIVNGAGYVTTKVSTNISAVNDMITNAFNRMSDTAKNAAFQRLIEAGGSTNVIKYGDKKMEPMSYGRVASELQNTSLAYHNEMDVKKKQELKEKGLALSAALINGMKYQAASDALGYKKASTTMSVTSDVTRASEQYVKDKTALNGIETYLNSNYLSTLIPLKPENAPNMFIQSANGYKTNTIMRDSRIGSFPTGKIHDDYMALLIPRSIKSASGNIASGKELTYKSLLTKNAIAGGEVIKAGTGFDNMVYEGVASDNGVMISHPIVDGKYNIAAPAKTTYIATTWRIPKEDVGKINIPQFNRYMVKDETGTKTTEVGYKIGGYNERLKNLQGTKNNPYGNSITYNKDHSVSIKVWIQVDPAIVNQSKTTIANAQAVKAEMKELGKQSTYDSLRSEGVDIHRTVSEIDTEMYGDQTSGPKKTVWGGLDWYSISPQVRNLK